jgi:hypothetical protein
MQKRLIIKTPNYLTRNDPPPSQIFATSFVVDVAKFEDDEHLTTAI